MTNKVDVVDVVKVIIISFVPAAASFLGAAVGSYAIDEVLHAATPQEALKKFVMLNVVWALIPIPHAAVAIFAMNVRIRSKLARRIAPWLLGAGFVASWFSIPHYSYFLSFLKEGWRGLTALIYFLPMLTAYVVAANSLFLED